MKIKKITTENERFSMFLSSFPVIRGFYDDLSHEKNINAKTHYDDLSGITT